MNRAIYYVNCKSIVNKLFFELVWQYDKKEVWLIMAGNIRDIARLAGVSVTTVSKVINNHPNVSKTTRESVQEVIRDEQFIPNHTARV